MTTLVSIFPYCVFIYSCVYIILAVHALMISESETQSRDEARGCGAQLDYLRLVMVASTRYKFAQRTLERSAYRMRSELFLEKLRRRTKYKGRGARGPVCDIAQPSCNRSWLHF